MQVAGPFFEGKVAAWQGPEIAFRTWPAGSMELPFTAVAIAVRADELHAGDVDGV